jgi:hypothetical protein
MRARDRLEQKLAARRREREQEEQRDRDWVIAEFGSDAQMLAEEILRLRHGLALVAKAINWMKAVAPFAMIPPGPYWKPKPEEADVHDQH